MSNTPTPRTDAEEFGLSADAMTVDSSFARQLERELAAEREAREKAEKQVSKLQSAPLCAGHADTWYCQRDTIKSNCIWCELQQRAEAAEAKLAEAIGVIEFVANREHLMFAECTDAEEIVNKCKQFISSANPPAIPKESKENDRSN